MSLKMKMTADASGAIKALGAVKKQIADFERQAKRSAKESSGAARTSLEQVRRSIKSVTDALKWMASRTLTGALHHLGATLLKALVAPLSLATGLVRGLVSGMGRLGGAGIRFAASRGLGEFRSTQSAGEERRRSTGIGAADEGRVRRFVDQESRRSGFSSSDINDAIQAGLDGFLTLGEALRNASAAVDTASARGLSPVTVAQGFARAMAEGDLSGLAGLGIDTRDMDLRLQQRTMQLQRQGASRAAGQMFGFDPTSALVSPDAFSGPMGEKIRRDAERQASREIFESEVLPQLQARNMGAASVRASQNPEQQLVVMFNEALRQIGESILKWRNDLVGELAAPLQRIANVLGGGDLTSVAKGLWEQFESGELGKRFAAAIRGSEFMTALQDAVLSLGDAFGKVLAVGINAALDTVASRLDGSARDWLGLQTREERIASQQTEGAMRMLANSQTREGMRAHRDITQGMADASGGSFLGMLSGVRTTDPAIVAANRLGEAHFRQRAMHAAGVHAGFVPSMRDADLSAAGQSLGAAFMATAGVVGNIGGFLGSIAGAAATSFEQARLRRTMDDTSLYYTQQRTQSAGALP